MINTLAKNIKLLALDSDGVLTTGALFFTANGEEIKVFHVHDGFGIKALLKNGIEVAIISGRNSEAVNKRAKELGMKYVYQGIDDKLSVLDSLMQKLNINYNELAYIGDDLPDLPALEKAGLSIAVSNARKELLQKVKLITKAKGGEGAVREVCDLLLKAK